MRTLFLAIAVLLLSAAPSIPGLAEAEDGAPAQPPAAAADAAPSEQPPPAEPTPEDKADADIGKAAAEAVEKQYKIVSDSPAVPKLMAIIDRIRPFTEKPYQEYQVKVINNDAINAFSLPGGYLYFNRGLLNAVESDDELAAVLGHEMAHVCLSHSRRLMSKSERYNKILGPIVLASILSQSRSVDPGQIAVVGSLVVEDAINHYGREAELEADHQSVVYLRKSKAYNPVAMLTVTEGLAHLEAGQVQVDPGVFQTHPLAKERVERILVQLQDFGIPIYRRQVTKSLVASAATATEGDREIGEIRLAAAGARPWSEVVFRPAVDVDGLGPMARAQQAADTMNSLLLQDLQAMEIATVKDGNGVAARARGQVLFTITPGDAEFHKTDVDALSQQAMQVLRAAFQQEKVTRAY